MGDGSGHIFSYEKTCHFRHFLTRKVKLKTNKTNKVVN